MIPYDTHDAACSPAIFSAPKHMKRRFFKAMRSILDLKVKIIAVAFFFCHFAHAQSGDPTDIFFTDCGFILAGELASPSCVGASDGSALIYPFFGGDLSYEWIGLDNFTNNADGLSAGVYALVVSDGTCSDTISVPLQDPPAIVAPLLDTAICAFSAPINVLDGVSGGAGGYSVTEIVSLLGADVACAPCAGNVVVIDQTTLLEVFLQDANGCSASRLVFVSLLDALTATAITSPETCNDNGRMEVLADGGSGNYLYALNNATNNDFQLSNIFEGLPGGEDYTALVLDLAGCMTTADAQVGLAPNFSPASIAASNATCYGSNNGEILINGTNGNVIGYGLNSASLLSTQPFFGNLPPGNYTVFVIEPNNCVNGYPAVIMQPDSLHITTNLDDVSCPDGTDGMALIEATGGNGGYRYALNNSIFGQSNLFEHLQAGTYLARVRDMRFCEKNRVFTITAPEPPDLGPIVSPSCVGDPSGSIVIVEAGKLLIGDYQFSLDSIHWQTENLFENLDPGVYTVYIRYPDGCVFNVIAIVSQSNAPGIFLSYEDPSCFGLANGIIAIDAEGGQPPFDFALNDGAFQPDSIFTELEAGVYLVRIKDGNACEFSFSLQLDQPSELETSYQAEPMGDGLWYVDLVVTGGVTPYTYAWSNGSTTEDQFNLPTGNHEVSVTDAQGCESVLMVMAGTTAVGEFSLSTGVRVFPVPAHDLVQVRFDMPVADEVRARLSDARGTALWESVLPGGNYLEVPLEKFPAGVYWLLLESGQQRKVFRLIKI